MRRKRESGREEESKRREGKRGGSKEEEKWKRKGESEGGGGGMKRKRGRNGGKRELKMKVLKQLRHHFYAIITPYLINAKWNVPEWFVLCSSIQHHLLIHSPEIFEIT